MNMMNEKESLSGGVMGIIRETIQQKEHEGQDDAFFVVDLDAIGSKYSEWKTSLPDVEPFYAVKCNSDKGVLKYMASIGLSFDCASKNEIESVLSLGVPPNRIIYTQPHKALSHLKYARDNGVDLHVFDCEDELDKLNKCFPSARLLLRIVPASDTKSIIDLGEKYGCEEGEAQRLLRKAKQNGQDVVGISFHVGWSCQNSEAYTIAMKQSSELFLFGKEIGFDMNIMDIGGGFTSDKFKAITQGVKNGLKYNFPVNCRFIAEPGTFMVQTTAALVTQVIGKKDSRGDGSVVNYILNDGRRGSFTAFNSRRMKYGPVGPFLVEAKGEKLLSKSILWGPTCDSLDRIVGEYLLPDLDTGDWLYFTRAGAYMLPFQTDFNGMPRSKCICFSRTSTTRH